MRFHGYRSGWSTFCRTIDVKAMGWNNDADAARWLLSTQLEDPICYRHSKFVVSWRALGSPYYDVYPAVIKSLSTMSLDFPGNQITQPSGLTDLLLKMPDADHCLREGDIVVRNIFISFQPVNDAVGGDLTTGIIVGIDIGECSASPGEEDFPIFTLRIFPIDDRNVHETINCLARHHTSNMGVQVSEQLMDKCIRLAIGICMLQDDPSLIEPQVLNKDEQRLSEENREKLVVKARKRGKYGFSVGKQIEVIPHIRRPHMALVWTGKGRTVPRVVLRKGSVVHRNVIEQIPTGKEPD